MVLPRKEKKIEVYNKIQVYNLSFVFWRGNRLNVQDTLFITITSFCLTIRTAENDSFEGAVMNN